MTPSAFPFASHLGAFPNSGPVRPWLGVLIWLSGLLPLAAAISDVAWRHPLPTGNTVNSIAFINDRFVAVGTFNTVITSTNGSDWLAHPPGPASNLVAVAQGGSVYVVADEQGRIFHSTDLTAWTFAFAAGARLEKIIHGGGKFVAVGAAGKILTSTNGSIWNTETSGTTNDLSDVAFGGGKYVAVGGQGVNAYVSNDGHTWTPQVVHSTGIRPTLTQVIYTGSNFICAGSRFMPNGLSRLMQATFHTSVDGMTWSLGTAFTAGVCLGCPDTFQGSRRALMAGNGGFVAFHIGYLFVSADGVQFTETQPVGANEFWARGTFGAGKYVGASFYEGASLVSTSVDGTNWNTSSVTKLALTGLAQSSNICVAVGTFTPNPPTFHYNDGPVILHSSNRQPFQTASAPTSAGLSSVAYGGGFFNAVGQNGTALRSSNGTDWVVRPSNTTRHLRSVCWNGSQFVAVGDDGAIISSPNGNIWSLRTSGTQAYLFGVSFALGQFVAVGSSGTVLRSANGSDWILEFAETGESLVSVAGNASLAVAVSSSGTVFTSSDLSTWTPRFNSGQTFTRVNYSDGLFLALTVKGGQTTEGDAFISSDGLQWSPANLHANTAFYGVAPKPGGFLVSGFLGTILEVQASPDPILSVEPLAGAVAVEVRNAPVPFRLQSSPVLSALTWSNRATVTQSNTLRMVITNASPNNGEIFRVVAP